MSEHIKKLNPEDEFYFKEGCFIIEVSSSESDAAVSIAQARVEAGKKTSWHWLDETTERYVILAGSGVVEVGAEDAQQVNVGDVVIIPPQTRQRISNTGEGDLKFLAICSPRFSHRNYHQM